MTRDELDMDALADELDELREARADGDEDYDEDRLEALEDLEEQLFAEGDLHRAAASGPFIAEGRSFEDYAMEVAEETLGIDVSAWPAFHIDWERAARDLQMDYTAVEFEGTTYLYQA